MPEVTYLIVGGGMTAAAAVEGIREVDPDGSIHLISAEQDPPYDRPPLSKGLWKGKPIDAIWRERAEAGAKLHLGRTVTRIDPAAKTANDDEGTIYTYEKLLLATGGTPRRLPFGGDDIRYYRTVADYRRLRDLADAHDHFAVIGGGFIGSEIAAALAMDGKAVDLVAPGAGVGAGMFPPGLVAFVNGVYEEKGVTVHAGYRAAGLERRDEKLVLQVEPEDGGGPVEVAADAVVAGIGIEPNTDLAGAAGLAVEDGIVVDEYLRAGDPDIYAAGDVANFHSNALNTRRRVEHEDNANTMGKIAGRNMAGQQTPYDHQPMFYSDLFDLGYEAVGRLDASLHMVEDWQEPYKKGVVYYLAGDGHLRGVLLWNVWGQVDAARRLIADGGPFEPADLKGRLPEKE
jgi:3-phenylpropionate/trans-cinnamate dioxygenase ferredoxin reductase subunit